MEENQKEERNTPKKEYGAGFWQWIAAALLGITMGLSGYIGGQNSLAKTVNINSNRLTAIETQMQVLNEIRVDLKEIKASLTTHIMQGNQ
jgi:hypothetical protein